MLTALHLLLRAFPIETLGWLLGRVEMIPPEDLLEVILLEAPRVGPTHAVPPVREGSVSLSATFAQALAADLSRGSPTHLVRELSLDREELTRRVWLAGGGDLQLALVYKKDGHPAFSVACLFVVGPGEDGAETPQKVANKLAWQMLAHQRLVAASGEPPAAPNFFFLPLYLWPATGLKDPQELADILPRSIRNVGPLSSFDIALQHHHTRQTNEARVAYHEKRHGERQQAARMRLARLNDAGISDVELAALLPRIDVEHDFVTLRMTYEILRLWEIPAEELLRTLPRECVGLALFGHLPAGDSPQPWVYRCGWALRAGLRGNRVHPRYQTACEVLVALAECRWPRSEVLAALAPLHLPLVR
jgi:hypothetical protein